MRRRRLPLLFLLFRSVLLSTSYYNMRYYIVRAAQIKKKGKKNNNQRINNLSLRTNHFLFACVFSLFNLRHKCITLPMPCIHSRINFCSHKSKECTHTHTCEHTPWWQIENHERFIVCRCFAGFGINIYILLFICACVWKEELFTLSSDCYYIASFVCCSFIFPSNMRAVCRFAVHFGQNATLQTGKDVGAKKKTILVRCEVYQL